MRKQVTRVGKEFGDYIIGKTIGEGTFGKVKSAIHKPTNQQVAIKILEKTKITEVADVERVSRQIHILKLIRHPNIVQLYEIIQTPKQLFLVMEYMEKGQLFDYIVQNKRVQQDQCAKLFHQLISGVQYVHKIGIAHRDLKPENILLDYKKNLKIVDFGLSNTYKKGEQLKTPCGSPCYAAPQMIRGQRYDGLHVDIWSCGVILFAMLCGYLPFEDPDTNMLYRKILAGTYTLHKSLSDEARDLISRILNNNQSQRYSIDQIRSHPWMRNKYTQNIDGIVIGYNKIPVDRDILFKLKNLNLDPDYVLKCLEANRHNNVTTTYYLSLKKYVSEGGNSSCDLSSKSFDKLLLDPHRRKSTAHQLLLDNYLTKSTEEEPRKKSKEKSREKDIHHKDANKQNRCHNQTSTIFTSVNTDSKKIKPTSKAKVNESFNYGRLSNNVSKSFEKNAIHRRQPPLQTRISRKYKQKFNQSLVSKSKEKYSQRSRINSSINGCKKQLQMNCNPLDETFLKPKIKKNINNSIKHEHTKIQPSKSMKIRRI